MHADSQFLHLGGAQSGGCTECFAAVNSRATSVAIKSSTFESPYRADGSRYILAFEGERPVTLCIFFCVFILILNKQQLYNLLQNSWDFGIDGVFN